MAGPPTRSWFGGPPRWPADVGLALGVGALQILATYGASQNQPDRPSLDAVAVALLAAGPAALVARRLYPASVLVVTFATTLSYWVIGYARGPVFLALVVAFVTAVMAGRRLVAWSSIAVGWVSFLWLGALLGREAPPTLGQAVALAAWHGVLVTGAEVARARRERAVVVARTRREEARRRASERRLRIAQELHDVLAHDISLINVQAGVALHLLDERPEQARSALSAIKEASREALGQLRSVLGVLRQADEEAPRGPTPGMADLDNLVSRAAATGLDVSVAVDGERSPLPSGVDLAAFRIVQEALTNVVRHAGAARAEVHVTYGDHGVAVQVDDDGQGPPPTPPSGGGSGIAGMRERAAVLGGRLEVGPRPGGGFRVRAELPVDGPSGDGPP